MFEPIIREILSLNVHEDRKKQKVINREESYQYLRSRSKENYRREKEMDVGIDYQ